MKTIIIFLIVLAVWPFSFIANAQFNSGLTFDYGRTNTAIEKLGVGDFSTNGDVDAKLHLNHFLLATEASTDGYLFRTDGDDDVDNRWQMFTGTGATSQTERFRIRTLAGGYDTYLERTHSGSEADIRLLTAEVQIRARGKRLGDFCELAGGLADEVIMGDGTDVNFTALSATNRRLFMHGTNGFLGIGSNFSEAGVNPNYNVHVHDSETGVGVYQQLTNGTSGSAATDGLRLGLNPNTSYEMRAYDTNIWLDLAQNNEVRMRFRDIDTYTGLNGINYGEVSRIMVPLRNGDANHQPISMMQLGTTADGAIGRNWMNVGTTYGTNEDALYVGWMERANSGGGNLQSDATLAWGCQRGSSSNDPASDNFRILFLTPTWDTNTDMAGSNQGKEVFRIEPFSGNTGIGNFSASGANPPGTTDYIGAKLDIDGDLRIRELTEDNELTRVLVVDENDLNRVHWIDINDIAGECDWNIVNSGQDLAMGYTSVAGACVPGNVGIGDLPPSEARLYVTKEFADNDEQGVLVETNGSEDNQTGIMSNLTNSGGNFGSAAIAANIMGGKNLTAARMRATADANLSQNFAALEAYATNNAAANHTTIAVYGVATSNQNGVAAYGIYGEATSTGTGGAARAGYFAGPIATSQSSITLSDQSVKTNVALIENATEMLNQLKPSVYQYDLESPLGQYLPSGDSYGFIAQEVFEVLPQAIAEYMHPAKYDQLGNLLTEQVDLLGIKYNEFIPLLVAGFQEQQATINAQQAQIEALTALVQNCCTAGGDKSLQGSGSTSSPTELSDFDLRIEQAYLGQNVPNPFQYETSITYRIPAQAMVRVRVMDAKGQQVDTLVDGLMPKGEYKIIWNASHLPGGLYFYTLEADGIELVKKAVKL